LFVGRLRLEYLELPANFFIERCNDILDKFSFLFAFDVLLVNAHQLANFGSDRSEALHLLLGQLHGRDHFIARIVKFLV